MRGRRGKQFPPAGPASSKLVDQEKMKQLVADQARYPPQHEAGRCQEFKADEKRIKYFLEVMELKLKKYWNMNAIYWRDNGRVLHLAMPFPHFVEYYWPGQVVCCGRPQENARLLEKHIHRVHKPPRPPPSLSVISLVVHESSDSDDDADIEGESFIVAQWTLLTSC